MVGSPLGMEEVACTKYSTPGQLEGVKSEKLVCVFQEYYSCRGGANDQRERESRNHLKAVSHGEWVKELEAEGREQHHNIKTNLTLKLLEFS